MSKLIILVAILFGIFWVGSGANGQGLYNLSGLCSSTDSVGAFQSLSGQERIDEYNSLVLEGRCSRQPQQVSSACELGVVEFRDRPWVMYRFVRVIGGYLYGATPMGSLQHAQARAWAPESC